MITVAMVEDDRRLRNVVGEVLRNAKDCRLVGLFQDGEHACGKLPALAPDVLLMDINLPGISGVECVRRLAPLLPETEILMLTIYQDTQSIFEAISAGAHGYLVKPVMPGKLLAAIREIRNGGVPMSPGIAREVIASFQRPVQKPRTGSGPREEDLLGAREKETLDYLVKGLTYKEIASALGISIWTVATYVRRIYEKLHVRTRSEVITWSKSNPS